MSTFGMEKKCPICGKEFLVTTHKWTYKLPGKRNTPIYYCTYTCFRIAQKKEDERRARNRERYREMRRRKQ